MRKLLVVVLLVFMVPAANSQSDVAPAYLLGEGDIAAARLFGDVIAVGGEGGTFLYDAETLEIINELAVDDVRDLAFSPEGQYLLIATSVGEVLVWDLQSDNTIMSDTVSGGFQAVAFSPNGAQVAATGSGQTVVWDVDSGERLLEVDSGGINIAFTPEGDAIMVGPRGENPPVIDIETGEVREHLPGMLEAVASFPGSGQIAVGVEDTPGTVRLQSPDGTSIDYEGITRPLTQLALTGSYVAALPGGSNFSYIWNRKTGEVIGQFHTSRPDGAISTAISISIDGDRYLIAAPDHAVLYDIPGGNILGRILPTRYQGVPVYSPDGTQLVVVRNFGEFEVFDPATMESQGIYAEGSNYRDPYFADDGTLWIKALRTVEHWNLEAGELIDVFDPSGDILSSVAYHPNGVDFAAGSTAGELFIFEDGAEAQVLTVSEEGDRLNSVAFSPDGQYLAYSIGEMLHILDGNTLEERAVWEASNRSQLTFSPDGSLLISSRGVIFDMAALAPVDVTIPSAYPVQFSVDRSQLVTVDSAHTVRIYSMDDLTQPVYMVESKIEDAVAFKDGQLAGTAKDRLYIYNLE